MLLGLRRGSHFIDAKNLLQHCNTASFVITNCYCWYHANIPPQSHQVRSDARLGYQSLQLWCHNEVVMLTLSLKALDIGKALSLLQTWWNNLSESLLEVSLPTATMLIAVTDHVHEHESHTLADLTVAAESSTNRAFLKDFTKMSPSYHNHDLMGYLSLSNRCVCR